MRQPREKPASDPDKNKDFSERLQKFLDGLEKLAERLHRPCNTTYEGTPVLGKDGRVEEMKVSRVRITDKNGREIVFRFRPPKRV